MGQVVEGLGEVCQCRELRSTRYIRVVCLYTINSTCIVSRYMHNRICRPSHLSVLGWVDIILLFFIGNIGNELRGPRNHGCMAEREFTTFERFTVKNGRERGVKVCRNHVGSISFEEDAEG